MGNMSDAVQSMVDEVRSAKEARSDASRQLREDIGIRLSEIRSDTHNLMERFHREDKERKADVNELKAHSKDMVRDFHQANSELKGNVKEMLGDFRQADNERKTATGEMLGDFRQADQERKVDVNELKANSKDMVRDFHQANSELKGATSKMVGEFASDHRQAHRIWTEGLKGRKRARAVVKEAEKEPEIKEKPEAKGGPPNAEKVMEAIVSHPEGIRLIDIGNEVGVDWRTLIGPTKSLVDENRVEKIENMYYPKEKE